MTWLHPSRRLWSARQLQLALATLVIVLPVTLALLATSHDTAAVAAAAALLALAVAFYAALHGRYLAWGYAERADDLLIRRGVLVRRLSIVPYGRMQFVDVTAGPVDRLFHLATVQLHTAAAATDARIPGLAVEEAHRLRDRLAALGETQAAGL
ncbi:MAG TPA: PH domain-containing protein [Mycobacteriales bacterium]|nr:PH domain-containing protein [Mycobacteriales bacterium]